MLYLLHQIIYQQKKNVNQCNILKSIFSVTGIKNIVFPILVLIVLMSCTLGMLISNCYKFYG